MNLSPFEQQLAILAFTFVLVIFGKVMEFRQNRRNGEGRTE